MCLCVFYTELPVGTQKDPGEWGGAVSLSRTGRGLVKWAGTGHGAATQGDAGVKAELQGLLFMTGHL